MADAQALLESDPALTANVLRLANSAAFGARREISTVGHALRYLGMSTVSQLAASAALRGVIPEVLPGYAMSSQAIWAHCSAVAALGEALCRAAGQARPEVFTAGLLHDVGKLAIGSFLDAHAATLRRGLEERRGTYAQLEHHFLGTDHAEVGATVAEVGATVAEAWDLPRVLALAARWHQAPEQCPDGPERVVVDAVHVANGMAHSLGLGSDQGGLVRHFDPGALDRLGLTRAHLERVVADSLERVHDLAAMHSGG